MQHVSIASFDDPLRAHLAAGLLESEGIEVSFENERLVADVWDLGQASFGLQLRVRPSDAERARRLVETARYRPRPAPAPHAAEDHARVALNAATASLLFPPICVYAFWKLSLVLRAQNDDGFAPAVQRRFWIALVLSVFSASMCLLLLAVMGR